MLKPFQIKRLVGALIIILLSSCGGSTSTPVNTVWNIRAAYNNFIINNGVSEITRRFKVSGIVDNQQITGTGFLTFDPRLTDEYEGNAALKQEISVEASYTTGGLPAVTVLSSKITNWYIQTDNNSTTIALGEEHETCPSGCGTGLLPTEFIDFDASNSLPVAAVTGNSGVLYQGRRYSDSSSSKVLLGTFNATYSLKSDNTGNAIFVVTVLERNTDTTLKYKRVMNYLVDSSNNLTLTGWSLTDQSKDITFN